MSWTAALCQVARGRGDAHRDPHPHYLVDDDLAVIVRAYPPFVIAYDLKRDEKDESGA